MPAVITVLSAHYRAHLSDHDDGVHVIVRRIPSGIPCQIYSDVIDAPFHMVADRMVELLAELDVGERT